MGWDDFLQTRQWQSSCIAFRVRHNHLPHVHTLLFIAKYGSRWIFANFSNMAEITQTVFAKFDNTFAKY